MTTGRFGGVAQLTLAVAVAASLAAVPARGDWLVTTDGSVIETRGGWEVKGRVILFHTANGTFSSMRLDTIDLEASKARTEAAEARDARNQPEPPAAPAPKAKFVLTDDDVAHVDPGSIPDPRTDPADEGVSAEEAPEGEFTTAEENPLEVTNWNAVLASQADGVTIAGVLRNPSDLHAADIKVKVTILDLSGEVIGEGPATLAVQALGPGEQSSFRALFSRVFSVGDARFEVTSFNAIVSSRPETPAGEALDI